MKKYDVTLKGHYEKTISIYANTREQAKDKLEVILFDTDVIDFTDDDFIGDEIEIDQSLEDKIKEIAKKDCCSGCVYLCPMCGECMCDDEA